MKTPEESQAAELAELRSTVAGLLEANAKREAGSAEAGLLRLEVQELRSALASQAARASVPSRSPKFSVAIDAVTDVDGAIRACSRVLAEKTEEEQAARFVSEVMKNYPALATAAQVNCIHRSKPLGHSVQVALTRLNVRKVGEIGK